ncbi:hypothetical protein F8M41_016958 [Gigaspora margarita]|uniref:Uncharacterized protein n=1 Tax=Gigaspora margarita TaxID=4874 RepID=A0A8H3WVE8_GIGMA|nr:hypothetical protein F8M41_016958 [Gigaspora margarita]
MQQKAHYARQTPANKTNLNLTIPTIGYFKLSHPRIGINSSIMLQEIMPQVPRMYNIRERPTKTLVSSDAESQKTRPDEDGPDPMKQSKIGSSKERPDKTRPT